MHRSLEPLLDTIETGDCIDGMRSLPAGSVDLVIADPPYNLDKDFGVWKESEHRSEWLSWTSRWLAECDRAMAVGANIFVYGIHRHLCWVQCMMYDMGLTYQRQIIWNYENGFAGYKTLAAHYEPILWFSKGPLKTYHTIREPYKSADRLKYPVTKNGKVWTPHPDGRLAGDVWKFAVLAGRRFRDERVDHPTQKPLSISTRIVRHFSNQGDVVLVPFAGSGSECVASYQSNRRFVGFEINPAYVQIANQRLSNAQKALADHRRRSDAGQESANST